MQLRPYQIEGRDFLASRRAALLADEMRVGKTPQAILAAHKAGARDLLVVCPAIAVPQWEREIVRWWPGPVAPRHEVMSYEKARGVWEAGGVRAADVFITDECHFAGNPAAARTAMVYGRSGYAWRAGATWALSGTPAPKTVASLWPMLRAFGVTGMAYEQFLQRYCTLKPLSWTPTGTRPEHLEELRELLRPIMLRRTRKDVAPEMPGITFNTLFVTPKGDTDYAIPAGLQDDEVLPWLEANEAVDREDRQAVAMTKVPALAEEIIFAIQNGLYKQTVVFGWHTAPLLELGALLQKAGVRVGVVIGSTSSATRELTQALFREGKIDVVVANIIAAGTAIDLASASHGYFLELAWVPGDNVQAASRLVSLDKHEPVTFDLVTWQGSVDGRVSSILQRRVESLAALNLL